MKTMLLAVVLGLAACGGTSELFKGDTVVAELSNGAPSCSQGATGPTLHTSIATTHDANGNPFESTIVQCDWTCGNIGEYKRIHVFAIFSTNADGTWTVNQYADVLGAYAPAVCP